MADKTSLKTRWRTMVGSLLRVRPEYNLFSRKYWFGQIDSRPLAVFRIALALLILKDAIYTLPLARIFYSNEGIVPLSALRDGLARPDRFSILDAMPYPWMVTVFLVVWIAVLLMLLVGYHARLATILNALLIVSMHERNTYVLNGADSVLRVLSLWSIFLPLGQYYSLDALRMRRDRFRVSRRIDDLRAPETARTAFAFPVRIAQIQIAILYFFTGILKLPGGPSAWAKGEALFYALQLRSLTLPTGDWVLAHGPDVLLRVIDYQTLFTEIGFALFVFSPIFQPALRILALVLGTMLHGGIAVTMSISNFSMVMVFSYLLFFEPGWITWIGVRLRRARQPIKLGAPPQGSPLWLMLAATRSTEIQIGTSKPQQGISFDDWLVEDADGNSYASREAWALTASHYPLSRVWVWGLRWSMTRRAIWFVLKMLSPRYGLPLPDPEAAADTRPAVRGRGTFVATGLVTLLLAALMITVLRWNLASARFAGVKLGGPVTPVEADIILFSGLWQNWAMFAPYPSLYDGWIIIPGKFEDGVVLDLRTGKPVSDVPYRVFFGPDIRWKKYEANLMDYRYEPLLKAWGSYFCGQYNTIGHLSPGHRLATIQIIFRGRTSHGIGEPEQPEKEWLLWKHWCYPQYKF